MPSAAAQPASTRLLHALALAGLLAAALAPARAAEHITLSNGFELDCDHRGPAALPQAGAYAPELPGSAPLKTRLYLDPSGANYLDVAPTDILSAELLPRSLPIDTAIDAAPGPATSSTILTPAQLTQLLATAGSEHNLDVDLLASVVHAESASHPRAVSRAGAQGLMQLMPATAAQLGVTDSFAPEANVHGGTAYLDSLLRRYHDNLSLALAAYNAGPGAVDRYHGVPPYRETRAYVARIIHEFNQRYAARQAAASLALRR
ncbi:MAG TPA: lytic transglycosylase domain-containing protein [Acidobacteriaceae bacterium]